MHRVTIGEVAQRAGVSTATVSRALSGTRPVSAAVAERVRAAVQQSLQGPGGGITISLGAAMYAGEQDWQDWFSRADAALYMAKGNGRNSVVMAAQVE